MTLLPKILLCVLVLAVATGVSARAGDTVTLAHQWGESRIETVPQKVVALSYTGGDHLLALGIEPVAVRYWYGGNAQGHWPWTEQALQGHAPLVLRGEIDVERIALLKPDLIEALWSGITEDEYRQLSEIAPVLVPAAGRGAYGTPWQEMLLTIGRATARQETARHLVRDLEARLRTIRRDHPGWSGKTAAIGWPSGPGFFTDGDVRGRLMEDLGFTIPVGLERLSLGNFYIKVSHELTAPYDADVLVWLDSGAGMAAVQALPLRHTMRAYREGREVVAEPALAAAMSFSTPLSLEYVLDRIVPLLEAAADGDPQTKVPSSVAAGLVR